MAAEFEAFRDFVQQKGTVVLAVPAIVARQLFSDSKSIYANYERLVGANIRQPAEFVNDVQRRVAAGALFASFGEAITYGALSTTGSGLPTYGDVFLRLSPNSIAARTTFLEENSYSFIEKLPERKRGNGFAGYRCVWDRRQDLAVVKVCGKLAHGQSEADWQELLLHSDGHDRHNDSFIEAHLYGGFTGHTVESISLRNGLRGEARTDARIAEKWFTKRIASRAI